MLGWGRGGGGRGGAFEGGQGGDGEVVWNSLIS